MSNTLKRATGEASITGATIYSVPAGGSATIIGCRLSNKSGANQSVSVTINDAHVCGSDTSLPDGSALDILAGSKLVAQAGDVVKAYASADGAVDAYLSYLEQV